MINNSYSFESIIFIIDEVIRPSYLNKIQEIILKQVWEGKTYSEIANIYNYDTEYIKTKGCELWKLLSKSFGTQINKSNFVPFMRSQINSLNSSLDKYQKRETTITSNSKQEYIHWTTAPEITNFQGRQMELTQLHNWSQEPCCRAVIISGMVGCGKTALAIKFGKQISEQFDYVIWFSLTESLSVKELLKSYLQIFASSVDQSLVDDYEHINSLLTKFVEHLRTYRCLLIIDDLDSILESDSTTIFYRQNSEEYAQLLRCLVATHHQSLSIFTSSIKPKIFEYYDNERVFFMHLQGLNQSSLELVYRNRLKNNNLTELQWHSLIKYCQYNPQIINIFVSNINNILEEDFNCILQEISLLKEVTKILEQELNNLSKLEKEMLYWLAINSGYTKNELLERQFSHFRPKSKLHESFDFLRERGLIYKKDNNYILQPLMKNYMQKKLIEIIIQE
ncbi:NB-ARC domain protein [Stanieria cyanosphaera PCC 7437]|uniref:NB-ARC domain protein n=1 Tax=Stanieria cyanosphaera (strain ATCC 29371 / PCC 7437) TaxID=111780 RepID=K9XQN2_STAC7|nr:NB-ARC domain-containing protein [Stanieria cyanosphaera]AFZ34366.1 NB-ARC domain protein [Stanieria cyanosphaera PCC 7437]